MFDISAVIRSHDYPLVVEFLVTVATINLISVVEIGGLSPGRIVYKEVPKGAEERGSIRRGEGLR